MTSRRWQAVYDADDLKREIRLLASRPDVADVFYDLRSWSILVRVTLLPWALESLCSIDKVALKSIPNRQATGC